MKPIHRLALVLAIAAFGPIACNDGSVVAGAQETPTPEPTFPPPELEPPIAEIDSSSPIYSTIDTAHFDGSWSYDPDGYIMDYAWAILSAPVGSVSTLTASGGSDDAVNLFIDLAGDYTIALTVTDDDNLTDTETFTFSATPSALHVQVSWVAQYGLADMDVHLLNLTGATPAPAIWDDNYDCHYMNCKPTYSTLPWGLAGTADDPRLDVDNVTIDVPENTVIQTPQDGTYRVLVHYYLPHAGGSDIPVDLTTTIWIGTSGTPVFSATKTLTATDQVWEVGDIVWLAGGGSVTPIDTITTTTKPSFFAGNPGK